MTLPASVNRMIARHPITAFLVIGIGVYSVVVAIPPLVELDVLPYDLPLFGVVGAALGVGLGAFVVTAAADGRAGVDDLVRRTLRWRVPIRWHLIALFGVPVCATLLALAIFGTEALETPSVGWPRAVAQVAAAFVLQLILFQLAEEIGWTGFLQDRLQDRYSPLKLCAVVALPWAVWHVPDFFAQEGWGLEQVVTAPVVFVIEFVSLFFARVLIVWLYVKTGRSVLVVTMFHASFDATINQLSFDIVPASNAVRFLVLSGVIVVAAIAVIVATKGRLGANAR